MSFIVDKIDSESIAEKASPASRKIHFPMAQPSLIKSLLPVFLPLICSPVFSQDPPDQEKQALARLGNPLPGQPRPPFENQKFSLADSETIVFVGQENFVREQKSAALESLLASAWAAKKPHFRSMAWEADTVYEQWRDLNFGNWANQLAAANADIVIAQFGQMEALDGKARLTEFQTACHRLLDQFSLQTRKLVLVSPIPFEKPAAPFAPDLTRRNADVKAYSEAIRVIARQRGAVFIDLFTPLSSRNSAQRLTDNVIHLNSDGLQIVAETIAAALGAETPAPPSDQLVNAIIQKNQLWFDCWRPANWSFAYGDRVNQKFAKQGGLEPSLREAFERQLPLVRAADDRIQTLALGKTAPPLKLPAPPEKTSPKALSPEEQLATFKMAPGYQINLFACEELGVINPTQISWDEHGRLYVACSPSYPQTLANSAPSDYILICEDTDHDGRADKSWKFAQGLTMVQGVEPGADGVYVCDFDQLLHFKDTNGDGRADERKVIFSGFGVGDTHQLINSICHGPDGTLWFSQGLHAMSRVETAWGITRLDRAAIWRFDPRSMRLEGFFGGGMAGANCWGIAFDDFGQVFHKSGDRPQGYWSVPGLVRGASPGGSGNEFDANASYRNSPEQYHSVGPLFQTSPKTTSLDFIGTKALPGEIQGCAIIGGYFGSLVELHRLEDSGSGFKSSQLPRLVTSTNNSFRPVDVSVGPDGGMYLADWYNPVIGHYQVSYADPKRDKSHGRIWRVSSKNHAPIKPPNLAAMAIPGLLRQLASPERWIRYQTKRLLFAHPSRDVLPAIDDWIKNINDPSLLREALGIYEAHHSPRPGLVKKLLESKDHRIRAYAARVSGKWADQLSDGLALLQKSARDPHPRVRLESAVSASYVSQTNAIKVVTTAFDQPRDPFLNYAIRASARALQPSWEKAFTQQSLTLDSKSQKDYLASLLGEVPLAPSPGEQIYTDACLTCHQPGGKGLPGVYPPLAGSQWVSSKDPSHLIKIVLHGLTGPITVNGQKYGHQPNSVPMPPMGGLSDQQIADVLSFVRKEFGKNAPPVSAESVKIIRSGHKNRTRPWTAPELQGE